MIIGVTGFIASGKGAVADRLVEKGFIKFTFSAPIKEELIRNGMEVTRKSLQDMGNLMRCKFGDGYWADMLVKKMQVGKNYVVEGIRNPGEIVRLKIAGDFMLLGVDAPIERRLQWILQRNKESDPKTTEEIEKMELRDKGVGEASYGQQNAKCFELADLKIVNDGTVEDLKNQVDKILKEITG